MTFDSETIFDNLSFEADKLIAFGFVEKAEEYIYIRQLLYETFEIKVIVYKNGKVKADVIDIETKEIYALIKVSQATGGFVGKLRTEYETILKEIAEKCFYHNVFKSDYAQEIIKYVKEKYDDELEFLWPKYPKAAILRHKDSAKWYASMLNLPRQKLGLDGEENTDVIDLRIDSAKIDTVVDGKKYLPGYHMNKKHWFTICLDGSVLLPEIYNWIDSSYQMAENKRR